MKTLLPAERLIVAADFKPDHTKGQGRTWVKDQVLSLADDLHDLNCIIKVNSALRLVGYELISSLHARGLQVFADLKLYDIGETLFTDGTILQEMKPDLLTTVCAIGEKSLKALKGALPSTEVLGVTILTNLTDEEIRFIYGLSISDMVLNFAKIAANAGLDGLISAPTEAARLREFLGSEMTINTPAVRPAWTFVPGDDQNPERIMTPAQAIQAGADRIVIGRPILQAKDRREAAIRTIEEIQASVA